MAFFSIFSPTMKKLIAGFILYPLWLNIIAQSSLQNLQVFGGFSATSCENHKGTITLYPSGGTPPYSYSLDGGPWSLTQFFFTTSGIHTIYVKDAAGQVASNSVNVLNYGNPPTAMIASYVNPSGCTSMDGSVTLAASGGRPFYTYSQDMVNWQSSPTFSGLPVGWYYFYVKDQDGCIGSVSFVTSTCMGMSLANVNATCGQDGELHEKIAPYTNNPPYSYSLDGTHYQSTGDFTDLTPGMYIIHIKDGTGTIYYYGYYIISNCYLTVKGTAQDATCGNNDGMITATASNGTPPYLYSIDGIHFGLGTFTNLMPGSYTVIVMDSYGKLQGVAVSVGSGCPPKVTATSRNSTCGSANGQVTAAGTDGAQPYSYSLDGVQFQSSSLFTGLAAGNYTLTLKDANGQEATTAVTVANTVTAACLNLTAAGTNTNCSNANGRIDVTFSGGSLPYVYSLDGVNFQSSRFFSGLAAGNYTVTAKDATGLTSQVTITLEEICVSVTLSVTDAVCDQPNGNISAAASGGVDPYLYSLDGISFQSNPVFSGLLPGNYTVTVEDSWGNKATNTTVVGNIKSTLTVNAGPDLTICQGASVVIQASSNGSSYSWQPSSGLDNANLLQPTASPSVTTMYSLTAKDGACQQTTSVNVIVNPAPIADAGKDVAICTGQSIQLQASGGGTYAWTPATYLSDPASADPEVMEPDRSTTYSLTVTDGKGCRSLNTASVTISVTPPTKLFAGADTTVAAGQPLHLYAQDLNNSGFTKFTWSPAEGLSNPAIQDPVATPQEGITTYRVTAVTDAGCSAVGSITIKTFGVADIFVPTAFSPDGDGHNDVLRAMPVGIREFKYFAVFSRWGQRIFYTLDPHVGWDGMANGSVQEAGTYVWMTGGIDYKGQWIQRKGTVVLIR
jgi:gliding motility-associated-like protein